MLEVGEYIRTKGGLIFKATEYWLSELTEEIKENIKSHSKNIIDLIEVGDIVNGCKVGTICYEKKEGVEHTINFKLDNGQVYSWKEKFNEETYDFQLKIETILTHEMYEQNCYEVGED